MSRPLRIEFAGAFYHVSSRGDRREAIYECDEDRKAFLEIFGEVVEGFRWHCHAYCLMTNHDHLFVERMQRKLGDECKDIEIPKIQTRKPAPTLEQLLERAGSRDAAIVSAHATGQYSYSEIGDFFGLHFATVGRIVRAARKGDRRR